MEAVEGDLLEQLSTDPILLCDVVYVLCKPEADQQNVTDEQFGQAMAGDAIEHATTALLEELVDFFPLARRRVLQKGARETEGSRGKSGEVCRSGPERSEIRLANRRRAERDYQFCFELAGILGINPGRYTLRELIWMVEAHGRDAWQHTTAILALMFNQNRTKKTDPVCKPDEINPYIKKPKTDPQG